jgi:hypothetical protein
MKVMPVIFDFDRDNKVGLLDSLWGGGGMRWGMVGGGIDTCLEATVDESFV